MEELLLKAYDIIQKELHLWFEILVKFLPKTFIALLVLFLFYLVARPIRRFSLRILSRLLDSPTIINAFSNFIFYGIIITGFFSALSIMELSRAVTSLLAGAGVIGLALSFAFQDLATNFISGFFITIQRPFEVGHFIETNSYAGYVDRINLRTVSIRSLDGQFIIIPSKDIFQNVLINYNTIYYRRVNLEVGVSYGEDLERVSRITREAISNLEEVYTERGPILIHFHTFGDSSINFTLKFWIKDSNPIFYNEVVSKAVIAVKKAFDANDIMIPFPIRTLDFGIKGGEKLEEVIKSSFANKPDNTD